MTVEIKIPDLGESIAEVLIVEWLKAEGDLVEPDEPLALIETDKANVELPAPARGRLTRRLKPANEWAAVGEVVAHLEPVADGAEAPRSAAAPTAKVSEERAEAASSKPGVVEPAVMPAARRLMAERGLTPREVQGSGRGGRILKEDVLRHLERRPGAGLPAAAEPAPPAAAAARQEDVVPMSPLRRAVARRLVEAQQTAALLTTFNEIDMTVVRELRRDYGPAFREKYGLKLGLMSFFVKAVVEALKQFPEVNASLRENDIVYHNYYDIGIAVGGGKGLVVPVLRQAETLGFAEIERTIADFAERAEKGALKLEELQGGTFTISNGGVYGSLLSTPIVNPPQSALLGLHAIQDRPVARAGQLEIRPMMYVALTYDHRLIDGREAVGFLRRVKEIVEQPGRMLLEV